MQISPALAADPDRAALIALAFALCNEQALYLHLAPGLSSPGQERSIQHRLRAPRPGEGVGSVGAVTTGWLGYLMLALVLGTFVLWIFSTTLWLIDTLALFALVFVVLAVARLRPRSAQKGPTPGRSLKNL